LDTLSDYWIVPREKTKQEYRCIDVVPLPDIYHIVATHRLPICIQNILYMQRRVREFEAEGLIKSSREYESQAPVSLLRRFPNLLLLLRIAHRCEKPCVSRIPILIIKPLIHPEQRRDACEHDVDGVSGAEVRAIFCLINLTSPSSVDIRKANDGARGDGALPYTPCVLGHPCNAEWVCVRP